MTTVTLDRATDTLGDLIASCTDSERRILEAVVRKAKAGGVPFDLAGLVHANLQADLDSALAADYQELSSLKAPPVLRRYPDAPRYRLPDPLPLRYPLDRVIRARASRRDYAASGMSRAELGSLLHYSYGIRKRIMAYNTKDFPVRYTPSAGGLQSAEIYVVVNVVGDLPKGLYHFEPEEPALELLNQGNMRRAIVNMSMYQQWLHHADAVIVLATDMNRLMWKYGPRSYRYAHMDIGYISGQIYLVATALRLRTCAVSGFVDTAVNRLLELDGRRQFSQLLMAVGRRPDLAGPEYGEDLSEAPDAVAEST